MNIDYAIVDCVHAYTNRRSVLQDYPRSSGSSGSSGYRTAYYPSGRHNSASLIQPADYEILQSISRTDSLLQSPLRTGIRSRPILGADTRSGTSLQTDTRSRPSLGSSTSLLQRQSRIDDCACCYGKGLDFCCTRCMNKGGSVNRRINTNRLAQKMNILRRQSCSCCEPTGGNGRCCQICRYLSAQPDGQTDHVTERQHTASSYNI